MEVSQQTSCDNTRDRRVPVRKLGDCHVRVTPELAHRLTSLVIRMLILLLCKVTGDSQAWNACSANGNKLPRPVSVTLELTLGEVNETYRTK